MVGRRGGLSSGAGRRCKDVREQGEHGLTVTKLALQATGINKPEAQIRAGLVLCNLYSWGGAPYSMGADRLP